MVIHKRFALSRRNEQAPDEDLLYYWTKVDAEGSQGREIVRSAVGTKDCFGREGERHLRKGGVGLGLAWGESIRSSADSGGVVLSGSYFVLLMSSRYESFTQEAKKAERQGGEWSFSRQWNT